MFKILIGIALIISAFVIEAMWLGVCFGSVIVGVLLLIFAPGILFAPFNVLFVAGMAFFAYGQDTQADSQANDYSYNYDDSDYEDNYDDYSQNSRVEEQHYSTNKYYDILGCNMDDDLETIKRAYKNLSKKFHPDSVAGRGLDNEFVEFANKKMQEINEAYAQIKRERMQWAA